MNTVIAAIIIIVILAVIVWKKSKNVSEKAKLTAQATSVISNVTSEVKKIETK